MAPHPPQNSHPAASRGKETRTGKSQRHHVNSCAFSTCWKPEVEACRWQGRSLSCPVFQLQKRPLGHLLGGLEIQALRNYITEEQAQNSHRSLTREEM